MSPLALDIARDTGLLVAFAAPHSVLLSRMGARVTGWVAPRQLFWTLYGLHATLSLLVLYALWKPLPGVIWELRGGAAIAALAGNGLGWALMGWTLHYQGAMRQAGLAQWWAYVRGVPLASRPTPTEGPFRYMRHPIYVAMLIMIWVAPRMTSGHLLLCVVWTAYLVIGVLLKEARLARALAHA